MVCERGPTGEPCQPTDAPQNRTGALPDLTGARFIAPRPLITPTSVPSSRHPPYPHRVAHSHHAISLWNAIASHARLHLQYRVQARAELEQHLIRHGLVALARFGGDVGELGREGKHVVWTMGIEVGDAVAKIDKGTR